MFAKITRRSKNVLREFCREKYYRTIKLLIGRENISNRNKEI